MNSISDKGHSKQFFHDTFNKVSAIAYIFEELEKSIDSLKENPDWLELKKKCAEIEDLNLEFFNQIFGHYSSKSPSLQKYRTSTPKKTVAILDDEKVFKSYIKDISEQSHCDFLEFDRVDHFLENFNNFNSKDSLIILDGSIESPKDGVILGEKIASKVKGTLILYTGDRGLVREKPSFFHHAILKSNVAEIERIIKGEQQ